MKFLFLAACAALASCGGEVSSPDNLPHGSVRIQNAGHFADAVPVTIDGVRCILVNGGQGSAISCDWGNQK